MKTICQLHGYAQSIIKDWINLTKSIRTDDIEELKAIIDDSYSLFYDLVDLIDTMQDRGQAMEDRLKLYRDAIEELWFTRNK